MIGILLFDVDGVYNCLARLAPMLRQPYRRIGAVEEVRVRSIGSMDCVRKVQCETAVSCSCFQDLKSR